MRQEKLLKVLLAPHISEKTSTIAGQYVFKVATTATKYDVKLAVEQLFQVKVTAVNMLRMKGSAVTKQGRTAGRYASWKKAYVVLQPGQVINIT